MHVIEFNLRKSPWVSQRIQVQMIGLGGGAAMQFAWGSYKDSEVPDRGPQFRGVYAFSQADDTSSEGRKGVQIQ